MQVDKVNAVTSKGGDNATPETRPKRRRITDAKHEVFRKNLFAAKTNLETNFLKFAKMLRTVYHSGGKDASKSWIVLWGYSNFVEFAEKGLGWKFRTAYNYVSVADVQHKFQLKDDDIIKAGYSKMILVASYGLTKGITKEQIDTAVDWAKRETYTEFRGWLENLRGKKDVENIHEFIYRRFRLPKQTAETANQAIGKARQFLATSNPELDVNLIPDEEALALILDEWLSFSDSFPRLPLPS